MQEAEDSAKWLISAGIPLTKETLSSYMELNKVSFPMGQDKLLSAMAAAVSDGKSPRQADLDRCRVSLGTGLSNMGYGTETDT